jgi:hypothetical protein
MLCLSYYFLYLLSNKIGGKGRTGSAWKQGALAGRRGWGAEGRNDPNNVCTYEYINKEKKNLPSLQTLLLPRLYLWTEHSDLPILVVFSTAWLLLKELPYLQMNCGNSLCSWSLPSYQVPYHLAYSNGLLKIQRQLGTSAHICNPSCGL